MKNLPESAEAARLWPLLLDAASHARGGAAHDARRFAAHGVTLDWQPANGWRLACADAAARAFIELHLPLCGARGRRPFVVAQLGQSLDGCIATATGQSAFVTGEQNLDHLHRLRALADAVIVGAGTVAADNPRLTTRRVPGRNPLRVVLDPRRRLGGHHGVFSDGAAPTLLVCAEDASGGAAGDAELLRVPSRAGVLDRAAVLAALQSRGCAVVLVEGGGVTVSGFLEAGLLDRLHLAIAPVIIGDGRRGLQAPAGLPLDRCPRPEHELYRMGGDLLYDCGLSGIGGSASRSS
jgi:diaminohydroxyphosphoribosylaminopyrimidine deaminase / 5-amino-6-(5-phosphoribosylamino)uracil reductase